MRKSLSLSKPGSPSTENSHSAGESSQAAAASAGHDEPPPGSSDSSRPASHPSFRMPSLVQTGKRRSELSTFTFPDNGLVWSNDAVSITLPQGQCSNYQKGYVLCSQEKDIGDEILYLVFYLRITVKEKYRPKLCISLVDAAYAGSGTGIHSFVRDEKKPAATSVVLRFERHKLNSLRSPIFLGKEKLDAYNQSILTEIRPIFLEYCEQYNWLDLLPDDLGDLRALFSDIKMGISSFFGKLPKREREMPIRSAGAGSASAGHDDPPPGPSDSSRPASHPSFRMPSLVQTGKRRSELSTFTFPDNGLVWSNDAVSITLPQGQCSNYQKGYVLCSQEKDIGDEILYLVFYLRITVMEKYRPKLCISLVDAAYAGSGTGIHSFVRDEKRLAATSAVLRFERHKLNSLRSPIFIGKEKLDAYNQSILTEICPIFLEHCEQYNWLDLLPDDLGDLRALFSNIKVGISSFFGKLPKREREMPTRSAGAGSASAGSSSAHALSLVQAGGGLNLKKTLTFSDSGATWSNGRTSITLPQGQRSTYQKGYVLCSQTGEDIIEDAGEDIIEDAGEEVYLTFSIRIRLSNPVKGKYRPRLLIRLAGATYVQEQMYSFVQGSAELPSMSTILDPEKYNFEALRGLPLTKAGVDSLKEGEFLSEIGELFSAHCEECNWLDAVPDDLGDLRTLFAGMKAELKLFFNKLPVIAKEPASSAGASTRLGILDNSRNEAAGLGGQKRSRAEGSDSDVGNPSARKTRRKSGDRSGGYKPGLFTPGVLNASAALVSLKLGEGHIKNRLA